MVGGGSTEHKPRCRVPATDRVSQGRGAWRLQEKLTLDQSKPSADPDWNKQRAPKRTRPLTPPERPVNVPNAPESPAFLKAMLRVGEAKRPMTMPPPGMPPSRMVPPGLPPPGLPPAKGRLPPSRLGGSVASQIRLVGSVAPHGPAAPHGPQISSEAPQRRQTDAGQEVELWARRVAMQW